MKRAVPKGSDNYHKYKETIPSLTLMPPVSTEASNSVLGTKAASGPRMEQGISRPHAAYLGFMGIKVPQCSPRWPAGT